MSDEIPSCVEDLANELWLEIFDYLDWINLFSAFYGINKRINQLIMYIKVLSLYSSYLTNQSNSIYICFKEFPLEQFKQIQHFQLTYDRLYEDSLNIAKYFSSFSTLISFTLDANRAEGCECTNEFAMIIFRQHCPFLQRLYLHGNVFEQGLQITKGVCMFHFPSLLYIHVNKLPFNLAIQLLDQCTQLRSFSAILYDYPMEDTMTAWSTLLPTRIRMGLPAMKKFSIGENNCFEKESTSTFLELLLPCCPNLRTFIFDSRSNENCEKLLNPTWWAHVFASNNILKRISLHLQWWTRQIGQNGHGKIRSFHSSSFFTQLNADIRHEFASEFMRSMTYDLYIKI